MTQIEIRTRDGLCPAYVSHPAGSGPWPGVIVFMDALAIRPAMLEIGEKLAAHGYYVLLPDLFYRSGPYAPMNAHTAFSVPEERQLIMDMRAQATTADTMSDTQAFIDYLAAQPDVKPGRIGVAGYCMGGFLALTAAGLYPDAFAAAASYHGGRLATDAPDSPHLLAPKIQAAVYVGGATEDEVFPEAQKVRLDAALTEANVEHTIETYPAKHGWVLSDTLAYNAAACNRHWETLTALLADKL